MSGIGAVLGVGVALDVGIAALISNGVAGLLLSRLLLRGPLLAAPLLAAPLLAAPLLAGPLLDFLAARLPGRSSRIGRLPGSTGLAGTSAAEAKPVGQTTHRPNP